MLFLTDQYGEPRVLYAGALAVPCRHSGDPTRPKETHEELDRRFGVVPRSLVARVLAKWFRIRARDVSYLTVY